MRELEAAIASKVRALDPAARARRLDEAYPAPSRISLRGVLLGGGAAVTMVVAHGWLVDSLEASLALLTVALVAYAVASAAHHARASEAELHRGIAESLLRALAPDGVARSTTIRWADGTMYETIEIERRLGLRRERGFLLDPGPAEATLAAASEQLLRAAGRGALPSSRVRTWSRSPALALALARLVEAGVLVETSSGVALAGAAPYRGVRA